MPLFSAFFLLVRCLIMLRVALATEILALRQQLIVLNRSVKRPQLRDRDRFFSRDVIEALERLAGSLGHRQTRDSC